MPKPKSYQHSLPYIACMPPTAQTRATILRAPMTAATEHRPEVLLLQSAAMNANVVFINIDWNASTHNKTLKANMTLLGETIANVVHNMSPTMICMCEVGVQTSSVTEEQMQQVAEQSMHAWKEAVTEDIELRSTIYDHLHRWLNPMLMPAHPQGPLLCRRATTHSANIDVLWCRWCRFAVDMINVHAPSGNKKFTNEQRKTLLANLLQSNSKSMPAQAIGNAHTVRIGIAWLLRSALKPLGL